MLQLIPTFKSSKRMKELMERHYSQPKGFVGRQLIYLVKWEDQTFGAIAAGSSTRFLPGRQQFFGRTIPLVNLVNNTFYHIEKLEGKYPTRNFSSHVIRVWRERVEKDWQEKYGDAVLGWETLVELPRTGELYLRDGWSEIGLTKGFTCKRTGGVGTDSWTGKRVWDTENLRPKRVFARSVS